VHKPKINNEIRFMARPGSSEAMAFIPFWDYRQNRYST
jgi:hypothetical protein